MASKCKILFIVSLILVFCGVAAAQSLTAEQEHKFLSRGGAAGDRFGESVSVDGDIAVVGASVDEDNGEDSGSAYVFVLSHGEWRKRGKLLANLIGVLDHITRRSS